MVELNEKEVIAIINYFDQFDTKVMEFIGKHGVNKARHLNQALIKIYKSVGRKKNNYD